MAWAGWFEFGGDEIINVARTEAYAKAARLGWFKPVYNSTDLATVLGDQYNSPLQDDAPWTDPDNLDTYDFYGVYPLDVTGIEDSTATAPVTESTLDGGVVGRVRFSTRAVVFNTVLIGASECAVEAGFRWLKATLSPGPCGGVQSCSGSDLCYLACEPCLDATCPDGSVCMSRYQRSLHSSTTITGPTINGKQKTTDGGAVWVVAFTIIAGNPFEFGAEVPLIDGFMNPKVDVPYVGGVIPDGGSFDSDGTTGIHEVSCPSPTFQPLYDPLCATAAVLPPVPPSIAPSCFPFPVNFTRRQFTIPAQYVPLWSEVVPYLEIATKKDDVRQLRVRFYADVMGDGSTVDDPCAYCGDILFSYIPAHSTMVFDGTDHLVFVDQNGAKRRADSLVFGSDGTPFEWPELSCGYSYIVTVDTPGSPADPGVSINMSLYPRTV